jgi:hypothetical protein
MAPAGEQPPTGPRGGQPPRLSYNFCVDFVLTSRAMC